MGNTFTRISIVCLAFILWGGLCGCSHNEPPEKEPEAQPTPALPQTLKTVDPKESVVLARIAEATLNDFLRALAPISSKDNKYKIYGGVTELVKTAKVPLVEGTYSWNLSDPRVTIDKKFVTLNMEIFFQTKAEVLPNPIATVGIPKIRDTERAKVNLTLSIEEGDLVLTPVHTSYPINLELPIGKDKKRITLKHLDLAEKIGAFRMPLDSIVNQSFPLLGKTLTLKTVPQLRLEPNAIVVYSLADGTSFVAKGEAKIPAQEPFETTLYFEKALQEGAKLLDWFLNNRPQLFPQLPNKPGVDPLPPFQQQPTTPPRSNPVPPPNSQPGPPRENRNILQKIIDLF